MESPALAALYASHVANLIQRYGKVLEARGLDAIAIHSGTPKKRTEFDDQYWPLRPTPALQHWLPLSEPDCVLLVAKGKKPHLFRTRITSYWEKPGLFDVTPYAHAIDVTEVDALENAKRAMPAMPTERVAFVGEDRTRAEALGLDVSLATTPDLMRALDALRTKKTPYEIACLEEANRIAALGHEAVLAAFRAGDRSELELHLLYLNATKQDDPETPYKNIVAAGENAATLHHVSYEKQPRGRAAESLLLDAGATFRGYCSDVTRTWVKGEGARADAFHALIAGVEAMQRRLEAAAKVGLPYEALHDDSHRQVATILKDTGILKGSPEQAVSGGLTRAFFPHGLGHSLGLVCHDVGCALLAPKAENPFLRNTSTIDAGQVFTIEPGIYFIDRLLAPFREKAGGSDVDWNLVETLAGLGGVRIEDDIVVTADAPGTRNLTREQLPIGGGR